MDGERIDDPATFRPPHRLAEGIEHVLVNGILARRDGAATGARPGRVLSHSHN